MENIFVEGHFIDNSYSQSLITDNQYRNEITDWLVIRGNDGHNYT